MPPLRLSGVIPNSRNGDANDRHASALNETFHDGSEVGRLQLDNDRRESPAGHALGWRAKLSLEEWMNVLTGRHIEGCQLMLNER